MGTIDWQERDRREKNDRELLGVSAPLIAEALGPGWTVSRATYNGDQNVAPNYVELTGPEGEELGLSVGYPYDGKACVSGHFEDQDKDRHKFWYLPHGTARPTINVSLSRGFRAVANDITRRLLPAYLPLVRECTKARRAHETSNERAFDTATVLALAIGAPAPDKGRDGYSYNVRPYHSESLQGASVDIRVTDSEVCFDQLRVSPFVAKALLLLLAEHHPRQEEAA